MRTPAGLSSGSLILRPQESAQARSVCKVPEALSSGTMQPSHHAGLAGGATPPQPMESPAGAQLAEVARVRAVEFIRPMRGASQPHLLRCEDSATYVVKFQNNPQHVRVLANEMLASRLARLIGVPVADPAFVEVTPELIRENPFLVFEVGSRREPCAPGWHFGSRYPGEPGKNVVLDFLPDRLLRRVHNLSGVFLGAFLFDKWTCNCDGRQVIFFRALDDEGSAYSALLIDQGFCFNDGEWNFPDSPIRGLYPRRFVYDQVVGLQSFEPFLSRIENLEAARLEECVRGIPDEWCGPHREQLRRLVERIYDRRRKLRQAIVDAKNSSLRPFPNWV